MPDLDNKQVELVLMVLNLETIELPGATILAEGMEALRTTLIENTSLRHLDVSSHRGDNDALVRAISEALPLRLEPLNFLSLKNNWVTNLTEEVMEGFFSARIGYLNLEGVYPTVDLIRLVPTVAPRCLKKGRVVHLELDDGKEEGIVDGIIEIRELPIRTDLETMLNCGIEFFSIQKSWTVLAGTWSIPTSEKHNHQTGKMRIWRLLSRLVKDPNESEPNPLVPNPLSVRALPLVKEEKAPSPAQVPTPPSPNLSQSPSSSPGPLSAWLVRFRSPLPRK